MKSTSAIFTLLSLLLLFSSTTESRKDPAGEYWRAMMKDQPMPKAIHGLIVRNSDLTSKTSNEKTNCELGTSFTDDFEPTPNATAYPDDDAESALETITKDSEPNKADTTAYHGNIDPNGVQKQFTEVFEPGPHVTRYNE